MTGSTIDAPAFFELFRLEMIAGRPKNLAALYTEDAELITVNNPTANVDLKGRTAIEHQYAACFDMFSFLSVERPSLDQFAPKGDGERAEWSGPVFTRLITNDGAKAYNIWSTSTERYVKVGSSWMIEYDHSYVDGWVLDEETIQVKWGQYDQVFELFETSTPFRDQVAHNPGQTLPKILGPLPASVVRAITKLGPDPDVDLKTLKELLPAHGPISAGW